jgi:hypothetical protein
MEKGVCVGEVELCYSIQQCLVTCLNLRSALCLICVEVHLKEMLYAPSVWSLDLNATFGVEMIMILFLSQ